MTTAHVAPAAILDIPQASIEGGGRIRPGADRLAPRIAVTLWFLVLAFVYASGILAAWTAIPSGSARFADWSPLISRATSLLFFCVLGCLSWVRPEPVARRVGFLPTLTALAGTYAVWLIPLLPMARVSAPVAIASSTITALGGLLIIGAVAGLGRSFSITPQARRLVISGPYRFVRHPLYAAEEIAVIGLLMQYAWFAAAPFLVLHLALQVRRMIYEEALLASVFSDYAAYAGRTARLIPGVW